MEYVMTLSSGKAICFLNDEYDYNNENKNTLKVIPQKAIRMLLEQNKEKLSFIDNETFEKMFKNGKCITRTLYWLVITNY